MTPATMAKREALKAKLIDIAEAEIAQGGIVALRARDLANAAGCALGAIYTAVDDLGELAIAVNRRTVDQITEKMQESVSGLDGEDADDLLVTLAQSYLSYAQTETNRWRTLFSIGLPEAEDAPGFHQAIEPIVGLISTQLERLSRFETSRNLDRNARAIFAAVHGMISLGMEPRLAAIDARDLDRMVSRVVATLSNKEDTL
ncbi:TetR/AcrR family transcriptional regulator [Actibacterium sp.]|uniref:TetR/AcrR family transcriptional regulator n=1 Tax=Actibacterium sp. TaxID=1872125 RepID=UPI00356AEA19